MKRKRKKEPEQRDFYFSLEKFAKGVKSFDHLRKEEIRHEEFEQTIFFQLNFENPLKISVTEKDIL